MPKLVQLSAQLAGTLDQRIRRTAKAGFSHFRPFSHRVRRVVKLSHRSRNALRYLMRGDFAALRARARGLWREHQFAQMTASGKTGGAFNVGILTTPTPCTWPMPSRQRWCVWACSARFNYKMNQAPFRMTSTLFFAPRCSSISRLGKSALFSKWSKPSVIGGLTKDTCRY